MHPADIQAALRKRGVSQADIARRLNITKAGISFVIHGRSKSRRVAAAIARITGIPVGELWPGVYEDQAA
jgi:lambda repressor-like predicted transcriptional regulator